MGIDLAHVLGKPEEILSLPDNAATQVFDWMGRRGSGKSYGTGRLVEQLAERGIQIVVLDPVGVWWGLRLAKDGESKGLSIPVLGGAHADLLIQDKDGASLGELAGLQAASMILDVSFMTKSQQKHFVADFVEAFFFNKKKRRGVVHVVMEEAQEFCPQKVTGAVARMVGAIETMVKLGRNFGIGASLISQRPQAVNKDILNQGEVLVCGQLTGPQERKAIAGWVSEKGADNRDVGDLLPSLEAGEPLIWSPQWLKIFGQYRILPKWTFDSTATPENEAEQSGPMGPLPPVSLEVIQHHLLKLDGGKGKKKDPFMPLLPVNNSNPAPSTSDVNELITLRQEVEQERQHAKEGWRVAGIYYDALRDLRQLTSDFHPALETFQRGIATMPALDAPTLPEVSNLRTGAALESTNSNHGISGKENNGVPRATTKSDLKPAEKAILSALLWWATKSSDCVDKTTLGVWVGYQAKAGYFSNCLYHLHALKFISLDRSVVKYVYKGDPPVKPIAVIPSGVLMLWKEKLNPKSYAILEVLFKHHGKALTKKQIASFVGGEPGGGYFANRIYELTGAKLAVKSGNGYIISPRVFPGQ